MWTLALAGGWGSGSPGSTPGSIVDLLVALLWAGLVWRLAERHHRELRERAARKLVSFQSSFGSDRPGGNAAGPRTSQVLSFTQAERQPRDSQHTTAAPVEAEG